MRASNREVLEGEQEIGTLEEVPYDIVSVNGAPTAVDDVTVVNKTARDANDNATDVTATVMPDLPATLNDMINGDIIELPPIKNLVANNHYRINVLFHIGDFNKQHAYVDIRCEE